MTEEILALIIPLLFAIFLSAIVFYYIEHDGPIKYIHRMRRRRAELKVLEEDERKAQKLEDDLKSIAEELNGK